MNKRNNLNSSVTQISSNIVTSFLFFIVNRVEEGNIKDFN